MNPTEGLNILLRALAAHGFDMELEDLRDVCKAVRSALQHGGVPDWHAAPGAARHFAHVTLAAHHALRARTLCRAGIDVHIASA